MANKITVVPVPDYVVRTDYGTHSQTVHEPSDAVVSAQDSKQAEAGFLSDLGRATSNRAKEQLARRRDT